MKTWTSVLAGVAVLLMAAGVSGAGELKSGPANGKAIGAFQVVKVGGAADDGVQVGQQLCYRCKYGSRPMVMVFTRNQGEAVTQLTTQLNEAAGKHQVKAFVSLLGEDREELESAAKKLAGGSELPNVPVVVPIEFENGPKDYGLNPEAETTVILATGGKVVDSVALGKDGLNEETIKQILASVPKLAN